MKHACAILFFCISFLFIGGQPVLPASLSPYARVGAISGRFNNVLNASGYPASLANLSGFAAGVFASKKFLVKELSMVGFAVAEKTGSSAFAIHASYAGSLSFNETMASLNYAINLGAVSLGTSFNGYRFAVHGVRPKNLSGFSLSTFWRLNERTFTSLRIFTGSNIMPMHSTPDLHLASVCSMGVGLETSPEVFISFEITKVESQPPDITGAIQYECTPEIVLRGGITTATGQPFVGAGWKTDHFEVHFSAGYHFRLGISPNFFCTYHKTSSEE